MATNEPARECNRATHSHNGAQRHHCITATDLQSREQHVDDFATATYEPTRECDKATHSHIGARCNRCTTATDELSRMQRRVTAATLSQ